MKRQRAHRLRLGIALQGIGLSIVLWGALVGIALIHGADWPHPTPEVTIIKRPAIERTEAWESFVLVGLVAEVFLVKAWSMLRRARTWTPLGVALIALDLVVAFVFLWQMGSQLFHWETTIWIRRLLLRGPLIVTGIAAIVLICMIPDDDLQGKV